ncbi:MAG: redoxin domain-containing protein [Chloroflexi bacterium]|nr:redoxin domain-containing protein [Chloroflexota bacterium]
MKRRPAFLAAIVFALAVAAIAVACGSASPAAEPDPTEPPVSPSAQQPTQTPSQTVTPAASPTPVAPPSQQSQGSAAELAGISGWINSEPFTLQQIREQGKVVLIDFWTYTCVNCIRTLPYLRSWDEKYADKGLVILGVHSPEFEFEKVRENVEKAAAELGVVWPVAQDNDFQTWRAYNNRFWPAKYLIDTQGVVRYTHFGEGAYSETEAMIRSLLEESGADLSAVSAETAPEPEVDSKAQVVDPNFSLTRELYAGYERNYAALVSGAQPPYVLHEEFYGSQDTAIEYSDPGGYRNHFIYLQGLWRNEVENLVHARMTENYDDYVGIRFFANSVNLVMSPGDNGESYDVRLTLNDGPVPPEAAGNDVMYDPQGNSYVTVDEPRMYRLVDLPDFGGHELRLSSNSDAMSLFAFTFGAYRDSPENRD